MLTFRALALVRVIRSDEGLTLETSALESLYGGENTLSTPLINQIFIKKIGRNWLTPNCHCIVIYSFSLPLRRRTTVSNAKASCPS